MKQHLETHFKDRTRKTGGSKLTQPAGIKKSQGRVNVNRPDSRGEQQHAPMAPMDPYNGVAYPSDIYEYAGGYPSPKLESPHEGIDMAQFQAYTQQQQQPPSQQHQAQVQPGQQAQSGQPADPALHGRTSSDSCGLDALAAAAIGSGRQ